MSMYEMAIADGRQHDRASALVYTMLGIAQGEVPRFRDCWLEVENDRLQVAVYTRVGGGNRPDYASQIEALRAQATYLEDEDDSFDSTYATFRFAFPLQLPDHLRQIAGDWAKLDGPQWSGVVTVLSEQAVPRVDMSEVWREAIAAVERGEIRPAMTAAMDQVASGLKAAMDGTGPTIIQI